MPRSINKSEDLLLSAPDSKSGRLQRECLKLLREHERNGDIPTNGRFPFYELEQRGVIPKKYDGVNPRTGKNYARTPLQDVSVCDHAFARGWPRAVALDRGRDPQPVVMELCRQRRLVLALICGRTRSRHSLSARAAAPGPPPCRSPAR